MLILDPANQTERKNYKLMIGSIVPRPIAFVTTLSKNGVLNAAPFSYFNIVTADPPMISISVQRKEGIPKDTARNAMEQRAFVVHIVDEDNVQAVNQTAASLAPEQSEVTLAGLTEIPSHQIQVPSIKEAKIRMECVLERAIPLGGKGDTPATDLLIGKVVCFVINKELYDRGKIDPQGLKPVSRMAGNFYSQLGSLFELERPD